MTKSLQSKARSSKTTAAKKPAVKRVPTIAPMAPEQQYAMPAAVADWIERATSIMNHQKGEIDRLKRENSEMKAWRTWAEHRILRSDHE